MEERVNDQSKELEVRSPKCCLMTISTIRKNLPFLSRIDPNLMHNRVSLSLSNCHLFPKT